MNRETPAPTHAPTWSALARALDVDPSQLRAERKEHNHFPAEEPGGWNIETARRWRRKNIIPRPRRRRRQPAVEEVAPPAAEEDLVEIPGCRVTVQDMLGEEGLLNVAGWLGPILFAELTTADLQSLADHCQFAFIQAAFRTSRMKRLPLKAAQEFWDGLWDRTDMRPFLQDLEFNTEMWAAMRFVDRPGWWAMLPEPWAKLPDSLKCAKPLPHRAGPAGETA